MIDKEQRFLNLFKDYEIIIFLNKSKMNTFIYSSDNMLVEYNNITKNAFLANNYLVSIVENTEIYNSMFFKNNTNDTNLLLKKHLNLDIKYSTVDIFYEV